MRLTNYILCIGDLEQPGKGSQICIKFPDQIFSSVWHAEIVNNNETNLKIAIRPDAACIVGGWTMAILPVIRKQDAEDKTRFQLFYGRTVQEIPLYILFNPWSRGEHGL